MALLDVPKWFTGIETAVTSLLTALGSAGLTWLAVRRKVSSDATAIAEDKQRSGLIDTLREERDDYKKRWIEIMDSRLADQETIGRLKGLNEDLQLRGNELLEQEMYHQQKIGACDEKVRGLSERIKTLQIENMDLFAEVARLDPVAADRLTQKRWNPPSATGPEQIP